MRKTFGKLLLVLLACLTLAFGVTACDDEPPVESGSGSSISTEQNSDNSSNPEDSSSPEDSSGSGEEIHTHSYTTETTAPTCTEQGFTTYTCACGDSYIDDYANALQHSYTNYFSNNDAACTEDGTKTATCDNGCGTADTVTDEGSAKGHSYKNNICTICRTAKPASEGLEFALSEDGTYYRITGIGSCTDLDVIIPSTYNNLPVTAIDSYAFEGCSNLTSIVVPDSVISIDEAAFGGCSNLTSVVIGDGVTSIGAWAFSGCSSLTNIKIPDSVTFIGDSAFNRCSSLRCNEYDNAYYLGNADNPYVVLLMAKSMGITSCAINENTKVIYIYAFHRCDRLTSIKIPDSVTSIGSSAFVECSSLMSITIPFVGAVKDGTDNTHFGYIFGAKRGNYNYDHVPTSLKSVVITSATSIGDEAFYDCRKLTSVTIPETVISIGEYAFYNCINLTNLVIPDNVTSIGSGAFTYCGRLMSIKISDSLTSIGKDAFYYCSSLTSIEIPDGVTSIGERAFDDCSSLTSVYYKGTAEGWSAISISSYNTPIINATKYYYSEEEPTAEGNYWHYDENGEVAVW